MLCCALLQFILSKPRLYFTWTNQTISCFLQTHSVFHLICTCLHCCKSSHKLNIIVKVFKNGIWWDGSSTLTLKNETRRFNITNWSKPTLDDSFRNLILLLYYNSNSTIKFDVLPLISSIFSSSSFDVFKFWKDSPYESTCS